MQQPINLKVIRTVTCLLHDLKRPPVTNTVFCRVRERDIYHGNAYEWSVCVDDEAAVLGQTVKEIPCIISSYSISILNRTFQCLCHKKGAGAVHMPLNVTEWQVADGPANRCSVTPERRRERISICYWMNRTASTFFFFCKRVCVNWLWRLFGYVSTRLPWHFRRSAEPSLLLRVPFVWMWQDI